MKVSRTLAFDFNNKRAYSLPRLTQDEVAPDLKTIGVREDGRVIFQDLYSLSEKSGLSIQEAFYLVLEDHGLSDGYVLVLEDTFISNSGYRDAVFESAKQIPMAWKSAGYDEALYNALSEAAEADLEAGTTENIDSLCEGLVGNMFGLLGGNAAVSYQDALDNGKKAIRGPIDWVKNGINGTLQKAGEQVMQGAQNWMNKDNNQNKIATVAQKIGANAGKKMVDSATGAAKNAVNPYIKGAAAGAFGAGMLGMLANQVNNLTNQEGINGADPSTAAKMMNSLKGVLNNLTGRQSQAPPQQQGLIARMIEKIKNAIKALGRKVGLA